MSAEKDRTSSAYIEVTGEEKRLFPENFGEKHKLKQSKWFKTRFLDKNRDEERIECEQNVINCKWSLFFFLNLSLNFQLL